MVEDLSKLADPYALYLPAVQTASAERLVGDASALRAGRWQHGLRLADLNWLDHANRRWHYRWCLASAGHMSGATAANAITQRSSSTVVMGDSGGYQIATGALAEMAHAKELRKKPQAVLDIWRECGVRDRIVRWLDQHCDVAATIDMPIWVRRARHENSPFHYFSEDELTAATVENLEFIQENRDRRTGAKYLNVLQGCSPTGDVRESLESEDRWYDAVKDFAFEGWAFGSDVGWRGGLHRVIRRLLILRDAGLLEPPRNWFHVLGLSQPVWAVYLTAIQRAIRSTVNADFRISFDSASPYVLAGRYVQYAVMPRFDADLRSWIMRSEPLPTGYAVANAATPAPFPASSPVAGMFSLQDLNPRTNDPFALRTMDTLSDEILTNHNVYVYVRAMIAANNAVFGERGCTQDDLGVAVGLIQRIFEAKDGFAELDSCYAVLQGIIDRAKGSSAGEADEERE